MARNTFKIFDTKIQPILLYVREVWGVLTRDNNSTENVHTEDNNPTESVHLCVQEIPQRRSSHTKQNGVRRAWSVPSTDHLLYQSNQVLVSLVEDGSLALAKPRLLYAEMS